MEQNGLAWARFTEEFHYDRRPQQAIAFVVRPGLRNMPHDVVEASIAAGKAVAAAPPRKSSKHTKQPAA